VQNIARLRESDKDNVVRSEQIVECTGIESCMVGQVGDNKVVKLTYSRHSKIQVNIITATVTRRHKISDVRFSVNIGLRDYFRFR